MKPSNNTLPRGGQWVLAYSVGLMVIGASAISLGANVIFGLKMSIGMACIFGLADVAKFTIPMVVAMGETGWKAHQRAAWAVAVAFSLIAGGSLLLEQQAQRLLDTESASQTAEGARADAARARQELAKIDETMSSAALKTLADEAVAKADRQAARGGCLNKCEAAKTEAAALLERLGKASRRDQLQTELAAAKTTAATTTVSALGSSDVIAHFTGLDKSSVASAIAIVVSIFALVMLELLTAFSGDATRLIVGLLRTKEQSPKAVKPAPALEVVPDQAGKLGEAEALLKVQMMIWNSPEGRLISSRRELAESLGCKRSTFRDWFAKWEKSGQIKAQTDGNKTSFTAPRKAA